jgi:hypothetical protein
MIHVIGCWLASSAGWAGGAKLTCSGLPTEEATAFDSSFRMSELSTELPGTAGEAWWHNA